MKFVSSLEVWEELSGGNSYEVAYRSFKEGSSFAEYCKKARFYGFMRHHRRLGFSEFEEYPETKSYVEVFPESHLPFWTEPECKDVDKMFIPRSFLSKDLRNEFKDVLNTLNVPNILRTPEKEEIDLSFRAVSTYHKDRILGIAKLNEVDPKLTFDFNCRRSVVHVGPANVRDAIILEPDSLYTISVLDSLIMQIIRPLKESAMVTDGGTMSARIDFMFRRVTDGYYSYVRDIDKCGLTMNPELIDIIREWAEERYPDHPFNYLSIYQNMRINFSKTDVPDWRRPLRGHGLGMANAITTLIQIVLFKLAIKREPALEESVWGIFFNDDSLVCSKFDQTKLFYETDLKILSDYQILVKKTKSGIIRDGAVFCEQYVSRKKWDAGKEILTCMCFREQKFAVNITAAKFAVRSLDRPLKGSREWHYLQDLISYWGYEFHELEVNGSATFGGWFVPVGLLNTSLRWDEFSNKDKNPTILSKLLNGENADINSLSRRIVRQYEKKIRKRRKTLKTVNLSFIPGLLDKDLRMYSWDHEYHKQILMKSLQMRTCPNDYWKRLHQARSAAYHKQVKYGLTTLDVLNDMIKYHPKMDFYIPRTFWKEEAEVLDRVEASEVTLPIVKEILEYDKYDIIASRDQKEGGSSSSLIPYDDSFEYIKPVLKGYTYEGNFMESKVPILSEPERAYQDVVLNPFLYDLLYYRVAGGVPKKFVDGVKLPPPILPRELLDDISRKFFLPPWIQKIKPLYHEVLKILRKYPEKILLGLNLLWEIDGNLLLKGEGYEPEWYSDLHQYEPAHQISKSAEAELEDFFPEKKEEKSIEEEIDCSMCGEPFLLDTSAVSVDTTEVFCEACLLVLQQEGSIVDDAIGDEDSPAEFEQPVPEEASEIEVEDDDYG